MRVALTYNEKHGGGEAEAEFDSRDAIARVVRILEALGHAVTPIDVTGPIPRLVARLERAAPDLVFNFAEGTRGRFREAFYPALFEQLGLAHTGSAAAALAICLDKALAKRVVAGAGVRVPRGRLVRARDELGEPDALAGPLIVKPNFEGSSKGITAASLVADPARLAPSAAALLARYPDGVLVEELIDGIDVAVGWVARLGLLPPIWFRFDGPIYDYALKHETPERVEVVVPAPLPDETLRRLRDAATRAFDALGVAGYGRADFRVTPGGEVVFLEMNPLPSLVPCVGHDELYAAAAHLGRSAGELIAAILDGAPRGIGELAPAA